VELNFLPEFDPSLQTLLASSIPKWHSEVKKLLPTLPERIDVDFDNKYLLPGRGAGGFSVSQNKIALAYDVTFTGDRKDQFDLLRGSYYHECYHIIQGFVGDQRSVGLSAIHYAIKEGLATKFEVIRSGASPDWTRYPDEQTIKQWLIEVTKLPVGYDWKKWNINDPNSGRKWILFSLGTYIADKALELSKLQIESLANKSPEEILVLAKIQI
jgi:hypothetical protein